MNIVGAAKPCWPHGGMQESMPNSEQGLCKDMQSLLVLPEELWGVVQDKIYRMVLLWDDCNIKPTGVRSSRGFDNAQAVYLLLHLDLHPDPHPHAGHPFPTGSSHEEPQQEGNAIECSPANRSQACCGCDSVAQKNKGCA